MAKSRQTGTDFIDALPEQGERRLMLAVLIDAIRTLSQGSLRLPPQQRLAWLRDRAWMQREDMADPFSFVSICAALGLSPGYVRRRVQLMQHENTSLRLHRYAAKVEESWDRQRRRVDAGDNPVVVSLEEHKSTRPRPAIPVARTGLTNVAEQFAVDWS